MAHPLGFGRHVGLVVAALTDHQWNSLIDVDAVFHELGFLFGVVGHQMDAFDPHLVEHVSCDAGGAGIAGVAKR